MRDKETRQTGKRGFYEARGYGQYACVDGWVARVSGDITCSSLYAA